MANPEHVEILKQGVKVWNRWREENPLTIPDLAGAHLERRQLADANFSEACLTEAYLSHSNLSRADMSRADLRGSDLHHAVSDNTDLDSADFSLSTLNNATFVGAILAQTNLNRAMLIRTQLSGAVLKGTNFSSATIDETNFIRAMIDETLFSNVDLSSARNLDRVRATGPCTIGIDTIYKSGGKIPEAFLRSCGVPESFITYMQSFTMNPIEYYSCFISHAAKDAEFAERLHSDLQNKAVRCWYAPEDMKGGKMIYPQIDEAIKIHDKLILILSKTSIRSPWVTTEIKRTKRYEEKEGRQRLFPISLMPYEELREWELFDADRGTDLAAEVRSYFIPDFSNWKDHDSYKQAFGRLLKALKAGE